MRLVIYSDDNIDMIFLKDYFVSEGQITDSPTVTAAQNVTEKMQFCCLLANWTACSQILLASATLGTNKDVCGPQTYKNDL
jgi:hypothetical protein